MLFGLSQIEDWFGLILISFLFPSQLVSTSNKLAEKVRLSLKYEEAKRRYSSCSPASILTLYI